MQFYTKGEDGNFTEATQEQIDGIFQPRFERFKKTESANIRGEVEKTVREELTPKLTEELQTQIKAEYEPKLAEAEDKIKKFDIQVRQKTIAAEYGFKPETEKYLGEGTDEEMRKEADNLKNNFGGATKVLEKISNNGGKSEVQERTGVKVVI